MVETPKKEKKSILSDEELFSVEELEDLQLKARQQVLEDRKKVLRKKYFADMLREESFKVDPNETLHMFQIELPEYTSYVMVDNVRYIHGVIYKFTTSQLASIRDIVQNAWRHERSIKEVSSATYDRSHLNVISANYS